MKRRSEKKKKKEEIQAEVILNEKDEIEKATKRVDLIKDWVRIYKTQFLFDQCKDLNFDGIELKLADICNNNKTTPIRMSVYCYTNSGDHELYGRAVTSIREIEMEKDDNVLQLINKRKKKMGKLKIDHF